MQAGNYVQDAEGNGGIIKAIVREYEGVRVQWAEVQWDADPLGCIVTVPENLLRWDAARDARVQRRVERHRDVYNEGARAGRYTGD